MKILEKDRSFVVKMRNLFLSIDNQERLIMRLVGSLVIATTSALAQLMSYGVLLGLIYFVETANCGHTLVHDFEQLSFNTNEIMYRNQGVI